MTSRERAATALHLAELELQRACAALLRDEKGARERWRKSKLAMRWAQDTAARVSRLDGGSQTLDRPNE